MRTRPSPAHQDAVTRRLELLRAELARDWRAGAAVSDLEPAVGSDWWPELDPGPGPGTTLEPAREAAPTVPEPVAPLVPVPGRHAARRSVLLRALLPEAVRGRTGVGPWHLAVVAIVVAVGLAVTCWWLVRGRAAPVPLPATASAQALVPLSAASAAPAALSAGASASPTAHVTVDVEGRVRHPGIAVLPAGSRVIDAVHQAGGAVRRRFLGGLNLAAVLVDGQQVLVGAQAGTAAGTVASGAASPGSGPGTLVDLNTATAEELDTLPEVGPVTAQAILDWRTQNGGFTSVQELLEVDGIGEATLAKIEPYVTV